MALPQSAPESDASSSWLRAAVAMLPSVLISAAVSVVALCGFTAWQPLGDLHGSNNEAGNYLQTVGTIYGVLLAFVTSAVWSQFDEARRAVATEANEVADLYRTAEGLPAHNRRVVQHALTAYVRAVIDQEWRAMACDDEVVIARTSELLEDVWRGLHDPDAGAAAHHPLHGETLARFNELSDARTNRLTAARIRIPRGISVLLYVGAVIVVGSMLLLAVDDFTIHAIMIGALAGAVSHVLYVINDLDNAFSGTWRVQPTPFQRVAARMPTTPPPP